MSGPLTTCQNMGGLDMSTDILYEPVNMINGPVRMFYGGGDTANLCCDL